MGSITRNGALMLLAVAFFAQRILSGLPGPFWFVSVFLTVYVMGRLFAGKGTMFPAYFEDVFFGLLLCAGLGVFAWYLDGQMSVYTGKSGGPAVPAIVYAIIDALTVNSYR
ncbi:MAG TPA: hypothetical protein GX524_06670 [Firmicutes bacterium]|nr:hypothetical protein [Bacillota bacterium]